MVVQNGNSGLEFAPDQRCRRKALLLLYADIGESLAIGHATVQHAQERKLTNAKVFDETVRESPALS